ncbi:MAG: hypothetical protein AAB495_01460 [Patescibacteria group bacterium]
MNQKLKVTYGGWYQRTTLHLSEIYDLLARGESNLNLSKEKLLELHRSFDLDSVTREAGYLEFVRARTKNNIEVRYYEDGLYVLEVELDALGGIEKSRKLLEDYFTHTLNPGISYIFSLGAPTPKVLANIKTVHPVVVSVVQSNPKSFAPDQEIFGAVYSTIKSAEIIVHKTPGYIFIVSSPNMESSVEELVEMQIFFREFKDQLEKYLYIHRTLWEEITDIKEQKSLRGSEIEPIRAKLDSYQKTISLIGNRINQMGSYIRTRSSISRGSNVEEHLRKLFEFKFEVLTNTLDYIKEVWKMTTDYLSSAIQNIVEIKNQGASRGIQSLQVITSIGVVSGIIGYFSKNEWPKFTALGAVYFALIIAITWLLNYAVSAIYRNRKYNLRFTERKTDL